MKIPQKALNFLDKSLKKDHYKCFSKSEYTRRGNL